MAGHWDPVCENCNGFDTLHWQRAPMSEDAQAVAAAMLPLIVGKQLEAAEDAADPDAPQADGETDTDTAADLEPGTPEAEVSAPAEEELQRTGS